MIEPAGRSLDPFAEASTRDDPRRIENKEAAKA
jgi:hypothetical protein